MFPRRGAIALVTTAIALVLLFNFKTPDAIPSNGGLASTGSTTSTTRSAAGSSGSSGSSGATASPSPSSASSSTGSTTASPAPSSGSSATAANETLTGSIISTRYGDVEVKVTIANGSITAVSALKLPNGGRSGQISSYVEPILASEALSAQSARIDIVSGATYTSDAYARSLQSALDKAAVSVQPVG